MNSYCLEIFHEEGFPKINKRFSTCHTIKNQLFVLFYFLLYYLSGLALLIPYVFTYILYASSSLANTNDSSASSTKVKTWSSILMLSNYFFCMFLFVRLYLEMRFISNRSGIYTNILRFCFTSHFSGLWLNSYSTHLK